MMARRSCTMTHRSAPSARTSSARRRPPRSASWLVLLAALAVPGPAAAQPAGAKSLAAARQAFKEGEEAEAQGDLAIALDKFKAAVAIKETPQLHVRIGAVQEKLGRLVDALASYQRGLAKASGTASVTKIAREQIDSLRARIPKVTVVMTSPPPDLVVTIDGVPFSPSSFGTPVPVDPGTHRLHAQAPKFIDRDQTFTAAERSSPRIELSLLPGGDTTATPAPPADSGPSKVPGAILVGVGGAALVAGIGMLAASYVKDGTVNSQCGGSARMGCPLGMQSQIDSEISTINALRGGSIPLLIAGAAGVAVGAYFLARSPAPAAPPATGAWVVPAIGPGMAGLVVSGRF